jgi:hypothetical protein
MIQYDVCIYASRYPCAETILATILTTTLAVTLAKLSGSNIKEKHNVSHSRRYSQRRNRITGSHHPHTNAGGADAVAAVWL